MLNKLRPALHGLAFLMPLYTLLYLLTAPHAFPRLWLIPLFAAIGWDFFAAPDRRQPGTVPAALFDLALWVLSGLQLVNVGLLLYVVAEQGLFTVDASVALFIVGSGSGYSAIVVAHELVHRPQPALRLLGRALLGTVLYDHFHVEHVRGHHKRVGTFEDPATARHGETLFAFVKRGVPGQFASAWRLETRRLGEADMGFFDRRQRDNAVLRGVVAELSVVVGIGAFLGPWVALAWCLQAGWAVLLLEAVNYIEHWGLVRQKGQVTTLDSFDAEGWWTLYTLIGLSRHADHHAHAARPYPALRWFDESPKMPWGYWGTAVTAIFANGVARKRLDQELRRRRLGPYSAVNVTEAVAPTSSPSS